jgi:hypothetical protein
MRTQTAARTAFLLAAFGSLAARAAEPGEAAWTPPAGIAAPEFGIAESHMMYAGEAGYRDAGNGPYSVYVDNTRAECDDAGPGTEEKPRCGIPPDIAEPGTVVEIHGGPYDFEDVKQQLDANGSATRPVFVRGVDDGNGFPILDNASTFALQGQYLIVENLRFEKTSVRTAAHGAPLYGRHHIALRNLEIARHPDKNGSGLGGNDIVFYRNHVHHNFGDDRHGTSVGPGSERVWILDNYYHHNGGDAVQFCHRCGKNPPRHVYVGRNVMHSDRENAVDLKFGKYIVISENRMFGYRVAKRDTKWCFDDGSYCGKFSSGSDGSAIVVGSDGAPKNPWIIYNDIYDSAQGIRIEEVRSAWLIGNSIHDISHRAIPLQKDGDPLYILGNTIYDVEKGIDQYWRDNFALHVHGNRFVDVRGLAIDVDGRVASRSTIGDNLFWQSDGSKVSVGWGRGYSARPGDGVLDVKGGSGNRIEDPGIVSEGPGTESVMGGNALLRDLPLLAEQDAVFRSMFGDAVSVLPRQGSGR